MKNIILTLLLLLSTTGSPAQIPKRYDTENYKRAMEAIDKGNYDAAAEHLLKEINENSKNGYAYTWLSSVCTAKKEYGLALAYANDALKRLPWNALEFRGYTWLIISDIHKTLGDMEKALEAIDKALKYGPTFSSALEKRGLFYYEQKDYELSDKAYRKIINFNPGNISGYMGLGRNAFDQKRLDDALRFFDHVIKLAPSYAPAYTSRAETFMAKKDYFSAVDDIMKSMEIEPDGMAFVLMQLMADSAFTPITTRLKIKRAAQPDNSYWPYYLGVCHEYTDRDAKAITFYKEAMEIKPSDVIAERISNCYTKIADNETALEYINKALSLADSTNCGYFTLKQAQLLNILGRNNEALDTVNSYIAKNAEQAQGYYLRALIRDGKGDTDGGIDDFTTAITLDANYPQTYIERGNLYRKKGEKALADADYRKSIALDSIYTYYSHLYLGEREEAFRLLDNALKEDPRKHSYNAACIYALAGDKATALKHLRKAFETGFRDFTQLSLDHNLDNIRDDQQFADLVKEYRQRLAEERKEAESQL